MLLPGGFCGSQAGMLSIAAHGLVFFDLMIDITASYVYYIP